MTDSIAIILNSLLYILNKFEGATTGKHKLFKILYFAEQKHIAKYGKPITEDVYVAMEYGPVPSSAFDMVKTAEGKEYYEHLAEAAQKLRVTGYNVGALESPDLEWLSESEISCLNESFDENFSLSFGALTDKSHDKAWQDAPSLSSMTLLKIAEAGGANEDMLKYISSKDELKIISF